LLVQSGQEAEKHHTSLFGVLWGAAGWLYIGKFWGQGQAVLAQRWGREKAPLSLLDPYMFQGARAGGTSGGKHEQWVFRVNNSTTSWSFH